MIWESHYWKSDLLKIATRLKKRKEQKKWFETSLARVEQDVMLGFYIVRKLKEAQKLTVSLVEQQVNIQAFPSNGINVTCMNWHRLNELYDFTLPNGQMRYLGFICDQIIHSYVFMVEFDDNSTIKGILFCSDQKRNTELYSLKIDKLIELFDDIGNNYPSSATFTFNSDKKDYNVLNN